MAKQTHVSDCDSLNRLPAIAPRPHRLLAEKACASRMPPSTRKSVSLTEARKGFRTELTSPPPRGWAGRKIAVQNLPHRQVRRAGRQAGGLPHARPEDGKKHPAIIWITGGDCNTIGEVWTDAPAEQRPDRAAYRKAGIVMMFPSLRGGNDNPGVKEGFFGEVDDVLAAADFLAKQPYVDPEPHLPRRPQHRRHAGPARGGVLRPVPRRLLVRPGRRRRAATAATPSYLPFKMANKKEIELRSPGYWLHCIKSRTYIIEGTEGNIETLRDGRSVRQSESPFHRGQRR